VRQQKSVRTTITDPAAERAPDLVDRQFRVPTPNALVVADFTYVKLVTGTFVYVAFVIDAYAGTVIGWEAASTKQTRFVESAIRQAAALRTRQGHRIDGAIHHSDAGPQGGFTSIRYGERLAEIGAVPSIGTVGDSYDNALAETVNGYYKAELIYGPARTEPWKTVEDVELATLGWVYRHNSNRLHGYLKDIPPAEFEDIFYATKRTDQPLVEIQ
jgi:putative transposase